MSFNCHFHLHRENTNRNKGNSLNVRQNTSAKLNTSFERAKELKIVLVRTTERYNHFKRTKENNKNIVKKWGDQYEESRRMRVQWS